MSSWGFLGDLAEMLRTWALICGLGTLMGCLPATESGLDIGASDGAAGDLQTDAGPIDLGTKTVDAGKGVDSGFVDLGPAGDMGRPVDAGPLDAGQVDAGVFPTELTIGGMRPASMRIPDGYDGRALPLVVVLHGYGVTGAIQANYFGLPARVDLDRFFLIIPDGTQEASASMARFWNATDACCNFWGSTVDDVAYISGLIDEAESLVGVDTSRVYLIGHSNGGFMAYRMACEMSSRFAGIVSLAGSTFSDPMDCGMTQPVSVLQIHGDADTTIFYQGSNMAGFTFPGAEETTQRWAERAGCDTAASTELSPIDLDSVLLGDETLVTQYASGCAAGTDATLWHIVGGAHIPPLQPTFAEQVLGWMFDHQR